MAVPSYGHDLTDISLMESVTGVSALGGGGAGLGAGADFAIQGTLCVDKQVTNALKGLVYDNGATITNTAGRHFYVWSFAATPGLLDTLANGGKRITIGTSTNAYMDFYVEGSDTRPEGGNKCYPIRYTTTTTATRVATGSPGANPQVFGSQLNTTGSVKGVNLGVDAMRYGTGAFITAGDAGTPATFTGFAAQNDSTANRWGILTAVGAGFALQGKFVVGQNNAGTPTLSYFSASNTSVTITDTPHSATNFSQIVVDHASTVFNLTSVSVAALGTNNKGLLLYNNASTTSALTTCSFSSIGTSTLAAGVTATGCAWRQTDAITQVGATITDCAVSSSTASVALVGSDLSKITGTTFTSAGTGHAISIPSTVTSGSITSTNNKFNGYASSNGSTGNEAFHFLGTTGSVTLNVVGAAGIPSIRTAGVVVTVVVNPVTTEILVVNSAGTPIAGAMVYVVTGAGGTLGAGVPIINKVLTNASGIASDTRAYVTNQPIVGRVRKSSAVDSPKYKTAPISATINKDSGVSVTIQMIPDE